MTLYQFFPCFSTKSRSIRFWRALPRGLAFLIKGVASPDLVSDRQATEAVRSRIDWKYALSLELTDPGFDFSVLCEFRTRLMKGGAEQQLLDLLLKQFKERGWLKERGKQRTDSTHVEAAIRTLNRLEGNGETLRAALNRLCIAAEKKWSIRTIVPFSRLGLMAIGKLYQRKIKDFQD